MYEALQQLDPIKINFSASGMHAINIVLSFIMFGVALGIKPREFSNLIKNPKSTILGLVRNFWHYLRLHFYWLLHSAIAERSATWRHQRRSPRPKGRECSD